MNSALKHTLELFNLIKIDRDPYSGLEKVLGFKESLVVRLWLNA